MSELQQFCRCPQMNTAGWCPVHNPITTRHYRADGTAEVPVAPETMSGDLYIATGLGIAAPKPEQANLRDKFVAGLEDLAEEMETARPEHTSRGYRAYAVEIRALAAALAPQLAAVQGATLKAAAKLAQEAWERDCNCPAANCVHSLHPIAKLATAILALGSSDLLAAQDAAVRLEEHKVSCGLCVGIYAHKMENVEWKRGPCQRRSDLERQAGVK